MIRIAGESHVGKVRTTNEDCLIVEPDLGLFAVLDGMGGANAGDVASQLARDTICEFVRRNRHRTPPSTVLESAVVAASIAVFDAARQDRGRRGMGTTVVACLALETNLVAIAHVGDSRAYLLRNGRLQALTRDHTVVEELVGRGLLSAEEAEHHPHKNVLSRNLGARAEPRVEIQQLELAPGDRILLCSDGLYGYAPADAIQYLLSSDEAPENIAHGLIELALRGGGGDNVSAIVIESPPAVDTSAQAVQTSGANAWWDRREQFLQVAGDGGLARNPIVEGVPPQDALELVALSFYQAVYHDLERSTGVNVWTFAQHLAAGWFERGGDWKPVRDIVDVLGRAARAVVHEIRTVDASLGRLLDVTVSRALIVVELSLGGLLAERLRQVDADLREIQLDTIEQAQDSQEHDAAGADRASVRGERTSASSERYIDRPTIPFLRPERQVTSSSESAEVRNALEKVITLARANVSPRAQLLEQVLTALENVANDSSGNFAAAILGARELYGVRTVDSVGVMPLFDALDEVRILIASCVRQLRASLPIRVRCLRVLSAAQQRLVGATTGLVLEAVAPFGERLRDVQTTTGALRDAVAKAERRRADLERAAATVVDPSLPWGAGGNTEW